MTDHLLLPQLFSAAFSPKRVDKHLWTIYIKHLSHDHQARVLERTFKLWDQIIFVVGAFRCMSIFSVGTLIGLRG